jgi:hypothetical protein
MLSFARSLGGVETYTFEHTPLQSESTLRKIADA